MNSSPFHKGQAERRTRIMAAARTKKKPARETTCLVIASQPAAAPDPAEGALDDLAAGLDGDAFPYLLRLDDLDCDGAGGTVPRSPIGLVGKAVS